jgi:hypothetical protein
MYVCMYVGNGWIDACMHGCMYGMVMVRFGIVWHRMAWLAWYGIVWNGMVWHAMIWYGMVCRYAMYALYVMYGMYLLCV